MSHTKADLVHPVGHKAGEQHLGKSESDSPSQAGAHGQPGSHISGQGGREILGGSASARVLGQSVDEQRHTTLPTSSEKK